MQKIVTLRSHDDITVRLDSATLVFGENGLESKPTNVELVNTFADDDAYYTSTLRDISVIMHGMVGQGVTWELAYELSKRLQPEICKNPYEISEILSEIFRDRFEMTEEEGIEKFESFPRLYAPDSPTSTSYYIDE